MSKPPSEIRLEPVDPLRPEEVATLSRSEILSLVGSPRDEVPEPVETMISERPFSYRRPTREERDAVVLNLVRQLASDVLPEAGERRRAAWEQGWAENLAALERGPFDPALLLPGYTHRGVPIRLGGDWIVPLSHDLEIGLSRIQRSLLFERWLAGTEVVYEFGCGSGLNLYYLSELHPKRPCVGLDWTDSSARIVPMLGKILDRPIRYRPFDLFRPDAFDLGPDAGVITVTALEQIGDRYEPFVEFLVDRRPAIVVHIEPIYEFYDQGRLVDWLGAAYHRKRGYLRGFLPHLRSMEARGRIEILSTWKTGFGIQRHDPFASVVWRPR